MKIKSLVKRKSKIKSFDLPHTSNNQFAEDSKSKEKVSSSIKQRDRKSECIKNIKLIKLPQNYPALITSGPINLNKNVTTPISLNKIINSPSPASNKNQEKSLNFTKTQFKANLIKRTSLMNYLETKKINLTENKIKKEELIKINEENEEIIDIKDQAKLLGNASKNQSKPTTSFKIEHNIVNTMSNTSTKASNFFFPKDNLLSKRGIISPTRSKQKKATVIFDPEKDLMKKEVSNRFETQLDKDLDSLYDNSKITNKNIDYQKIIEYFISTYGKNQIKSIENIKK